MYYLKIIIGSSDLKANQSINQIVEVVPESEKYARYVNAIFLSSFFFNLFVPLYLKEKKLCLFSRSALQ